VVWGKSRGHTAAQEGGTEGTSPWGFRKKKFFSQGAKEKASKEQKVGKRATSITSKWGFRRSGKARKGAKSKGHRGAETLQTKGGESVSLWGRRRGK